MRRALGALLAALVLATVAHAEYRSYGPFTGFVASVPRHAAPLGSIVDADSSRNWLYDPVEKKLVRRRGVSTLDSNLVRPTATQWAAKGRRVRQVELPQLTYPTVAALVTDETNNYGALVVRASGSANYQLAGDSTCWNTSGLVNDNYIVTPWMPNGSVATPTRGIDVAGRATIASGSRSFLSSGNWLFLPNSGGTPLMWDRYFNLTGACTNPNRVRPWGQYPPLYCPNVPSGQYPTASTTTTKPWKEGERFYCSVIFRFEDGSYSPPSLPTLTLPGSGTGGVSGLVTVRDSVGAVVYYDYLPWRNIACGPPGTEARILCRTTKIDGATGGLPAFRDLRITAILPNNTQTSYDDPNGDDNSLVVNDDVVRFDHMWPKGARYVAANDARTLICGALKVNPSAIILSPTGRTASRDLNGPATGNSPVGYTDLTALTTTPMAVGEAFGVRVRTDSLVLRFTASTGTQTQTAFALATYKTLRQLVDVINNTTVSDNAKEWSAQIAPGADEQAASTSLAATNTLDFGDSPRFNSTAGIQWIRQPVWPGVLYFSVSYQSGFATDHQSLYFTGASPGHAQSAPLNFYVGNRRQPPNRGVGKCQGAAPIGDKFIVAYENAIYVLRNLKQSTTALDDGYRLVPLNETRGCCAWSSLVAGDGWVGYMTRDGFVVTDAEQEVMISGDIWNRARNVGEWRDEITRSLRATAADADTSSSIHAAVMGSQLHITYRKNATGILADRRLVYDFTGSQASSGLAQVLNGDKPWGWSTPLTNNLAAMGEAMIDVSGPYRIGMVESNVRGRWDKFDTGTQDGSSNITAVATFPTDFCGSYQLKGAEQVFALYKKDTSGASGLTVSFYRDNARADGAGFTLASSSTAPYKRSVIDLAPLMRTGTDVFEMKVRDDGTTGTDPPEIWVLALKFHLLDSVR